MTIYLTPQNVKIAPGCTARENDIKRVAPYIEKDGLIEPLKLDRNGEIGKLDYYDPARLEYCKRNNWPTIIVDFDDEISDKLRAELIAAKVHIAAAA